MLYGGRACWIGLLTVLGVLLVLPAGAGAHERRQVAGYQMSVGWADEPTYAGVKNAVQLILRDASGNPVTDPPEDLKVEVIFSSQKMGPLALEPAFGKTFGRPGDYRAQLIPTRPGNYTFHFIGSLGGKKVDESFTSSEKTFDPVGEPASIQFPAKDPSPGELAGLLDRLNARMGSVQASGRAAAEAARQGRVLGALGLITGVAGLAVALSRGPRRPG